MKFRGLHYDADMPSAMLFHFYELLVRDSNKGELDPYPGKYAALPPKKTKSV